MPTEMELVLEQTQQGTSYEVSVKGKQEKDKIGTKSDKNGKRGKVWQCRRPITVEKEEKEKKYKFKVAIPRNCIDSRTNTRAYIAIHSKINHKGQNC
nr:hypothetical protein [Tanacetum cinerariifolium]